MLTFIYCIPQGCSTDENAHSPLPPCDGVPIGFRINGEKCWAPGTLSLYPEWGFHGGRDTFGIWGTSWSRQNIDITFIPLEPIDTVSLPIPVKIAHVYFYYDDIAYTRVDSFSMGEIITVNETGVHGRFEVRLSDSTGQQIIDLKDGQFIGSRQ